MYSLGPTCDHLSKLPKPATTPTPIPILILKPKLALCTQERHQGTAVQVPLSDLEAKEPIPLSFSTRPVSTSTLIMEEGTSPPDTHLALKQCPSGTHLTSIQCPYGAHLGPI